MFFSGLFYTSGFFFGRVTGITPTNLLANSISSAISQFKLKNLNIHILDMSTLYVCLTSI